MKELLFATHNANKANEIQSLVGSEYRLLTLDDAGVTADIDENASTLECNALIKARFLHRMTGRPCFADDTGLEVDALQGEPGVHTARYAGDECDPERNMSKLLMALDGAENRRARFRTVVAFVDADGSERLFEGVCEGSIAEAKRGDCGFGYDPVFCPDVAGGRTFAEMPMSEKNAISHRGKAIGKFVDFLVR